MIQDVFYFSQANFVIYYHTEEYVYTYLFCVETIYLQQYLYLATYCLCYASKYQ